jgi:tripartite-type tricarboxylate transporter receptor subunit TctC
MRTPSLLGGMLIACCALLPAAASAADPYPTKPVRIVVGFPPSGMSDNLARALAGALGRQLGEQFIIDNRPGAGTTIAADNVAKSPPDGYTLFMQDLTSHAINASLYRKLPYDSVKDFTPITLVAATPLVMVVNPASNIDSVKALILRAKAKPGDLNYGSSGIGTILHLSGELFKQRAGIDLLHVPYKGATGATMAMLGGEIAVTFATMPTAVPLIKGGKITPIAVTTTKRAAALPEVPTMQEAGVPDYAIVPTMQEAGVPDYAIVLYNGILAPAGLPADLQARLRTEILKAMQAPEVKKFYQTVSAEAITSTPEELAAHISAEIKKYAQAVQASGARAD